MRRWKRKAPREGPAHGDEGAEEHHQFCRLARGIEGSGDVMAEQEKHERRDQRVDGREDQAVGQCAFDAWIEPRTEILPDDRPDRT